MNSWTHTKKTFDWAISVALVVGIIALVLWAVGPSPEDVKAAKAEASADAKLIFCGLQTVCCVLCVAVGGSWMDKS